jgi:hypothetical protein
MTQASTRRVALAASVLLCACWCSGCSRGTSEQADRAASPQVKKRKLMDSIQNNPNLSAEQKARMTQSLNGGPAR